MSLERATSAIHLEPTDRIPHWEFISHPGFERALTGIDPYQHPQRSALCMAELLDLDVAHVPADDDPLPPLPADGTDATGHRVVRWGAGTTWRWDWGAGVRTEEDVLAYEPLEHLDLSDASIPEADDYSVSEDALAARFQQRLSENQALLGDRGLSMVPGWYNTFFMWPLLTFGWELFLTVALTHPEEMRRIMADFGQISLKVFRAWARTDAVMVTSHDDLCYTRGSIFDPAWLHRNVYPWYERLWAPLREAGIKVVWISDGRVDDVADDIFACGADGLMGEPHTDLAEIARKHPDKILLGNIDNRVLMHGSKADIRAEVARCTALGRDLPGYFYSVTNHLTYDLPVDAVRTYFDACRELGRR